MRNMKADKTVNWYLYGLAFLCAVFITFVMLPVGFVNIPKLKPGDVSPVDIRSPISVKTINKEATERAKEEAKKRVSPVFVYNPEAEKRIKEILQTITNLSISEKRKIKNLISSYYKHGVISFIPKSSGKIVIITPKGMEEREINSFLTTQQLEKKLKKDISQIVRSPQKQEEILKKLLPFLNPNYVYSKEETAKLKEEIEKKVKPVYITLKKGEVIVRKGDIVTSLDAEKIEIIRKESSRWKDWNKYFSIFLVSAVTFYVMIKLYRIISPTASEDIRNIIFSFSVVVLDIFLMRIFTFFAKLLFETLNIPIEENLIYVPIITSTIFASMFITKKVATLHILPISIIPSFLFSKPEIYIIPVMIGTVFSCFDSRKYRSREIIYKSAFFAGLAIAILQAVMFVYYKGFIFNAQIIIQFALSMLGALVTAIVVNGLSPLFINIFKFTTDMVYMELINLNHPLLRKLILRAPGTYSHSVMVATLAEAAAETIGANALLAKAGGLFHDIGKLKNPAAFIENQLNGINIHDNLPPEKSAEILRSHVECGEELGRKYGLPEKIIDIIKQHHGTKFMKYFYHKAKELEGKETEEKKFRYPGPKPQFKESGIVMLADTVEAAVRSMKDKNIDLDTFIHKLIMDMVEDGQLNQSGLSLKDISLIEKVFKKVLSGVYHNRIEYPDDKDSKGNNKGN
ncbi:MAG: HDIG domain-containing metalloprotein [Desulfurobacteriaceae bacterium]